MQIVNLSKNTLLAEEVFMAATPWLRMKGLLGKKMLAPGEALVIQPCNSIHTLFMQFAIDVLFLDRQNKVVAVISSLKPFRFSKIYFASYLAIELPIGPTSSTSTVVGDTILIT